MNDAPQRPGEPGRSDDEHESMCRRCGVSCHLAIPVNGVPVVVPGLHCGFLDEVVPGRWACRVYAERFERAPWCHHADLALREGLLAHDCPYAAGTPGVRGKVRLPESTIALLWPILAAEIRRAGVPYFVSQPALLAEFQRREGRTFRLEPDPRDTERVRLLPA